jgi:hypothetical protein
MFTWSHFVKASLGGVACLALGFGAMAGCSSNDDNGSGPDVDAALGQGENICGFVTVGAAAGASCSTEGYSCGIGYVCGSFNQQAHCTCTSGKFVCVDSTQANVPQGGAPQCTSNGTGNDKACPASESAADQAKCATSGLLCHYAGSVCPPPSTQVNTDTCQCLVHDDGGLSFKCERSFCNPGTDASNDLPDAGPPPPVDAGKDAPADAPTDVKTGG